MTFGESIIRLRERLNDMRLQSASLITLASQDGVRWTSSRLISIINNAVDEVIRLLFTYSDNPILKNIAASGGLIRQSSTITLTGGVSFLPADISLPIEAKVDDVEYSAIMPSTYYLYLTDDKAPRKNDKFFTILYDSESEMRKIYFLPTSTAGSLIITYIRSGSVYTSDDFETDIHPVGIDDLILDIAEREAREREHSWDRANRLDERIMVKIGVKK